jgi:hypothetical protein
VLKDLTHNKFSFSVRMNRACAAERNRKPA